MIPRKQNYLTDRVSLWHSHPERVLPNRASPLSLNHSQFSRSRLVRPGSSSPSPAAFFFSCLVLAKTSSGFKKRAPKNIPPCSPRMDPPKTINGSASLLTVTGFNPRHTSGFEDVSQARPEEADDFVYSRSFLQRHLPRSEIAVRSPRQKQVQLWFVCSSTCQKDGNPSRIFSPPLLLRRRLNNEHLLLTITDANKRVIIGCGNDGINVDGWWPFFWKNKKTTM